MRIFYASGATPNGAIRGSSIWHKNLHGALVDLGHDVIEFEYDLEPLIAAADTSRPENQRFVAQHRPAASAELVAQVERAHSSAPLDIFFSYFPSSCATPDAITQIGSMGIKTVNWYCNASYQLDLVAEIAPAYDVCLVPEAFRLRDYEQLGANPLYCQEAANPAFYKPVDVERDLDVVFVGARYGERADHILQLIDAGIDVRVFGPGWLPDTSLGGRMRRFARAGRRRASEVRRGVYRATHSPVASIPASHYGGVLADDELPVIYSRAKIAIGFSSVGNTHESENRITQIRLRDFEAPMSGAFYIVEHMPELSEFFDIGTELETYRTADELVAKCLYYLDHPEEREAIRVAGHRRAVRDHTWQRRFSDVFERLGVAA